MSVYPLFKGPEYNKSWASGESTGLIIDEFHLRSLPTAHDEYGARSTLLHTPYLVRMAGIQDVSQAGMVVEMIGHHCCIQTAGRFCHLCHL